MPTRREPRCIGNKPVLGLSDVHAWFLDLRFDAETLSELRRRLSVDEEARVRQFRFPKDQERFVSSRGLLRDLLGYYVGCKPEALSFLYGAAGKPTLAPACAGEGIDFNLAHSGDYALVAIARHREVGIDIESTERQSNIEKIARRFFSPTELASFLESPRDQRADAFLRHWVRKEAYLKARGFGLTRHEEGFDAALGDVSTSAFVHADGTSWTAREILPRAGCRASVVAQGTDWHLQCFDWNAAD